MIAVLSPSGAGGALRFGPAARAAALGLVGLLGLLPASATAQITVHQGTTLAGLVVDRRTGRPVPGARVIISGLGDTIGVSGDGTFKTNRAAIGAHVVEVLAIGYTAARWILELGEASAEVLFELEPRLPVLDTLAIAAHTAVVDSSDWRSPESFEHRRHRGGGAFLTEEQIAQSHARTLADLLPSVPGVMISCSNRMCQVRMSGSRPCTPDYYLDGAPASFATGPSFPIQGVRAIEVYRAADAPIEFSHPNSTCGIIAIWTKMER